jgi:hypothetical protein
LTPDTLTLAGEPWRRRALVAILLAGLLVFGSVAHRHVPFQHWLTFRYLACWGATLLFLAACLSAGFPVVERLASPGWDRPARSLLALAAGVYLFFLGVFALGLLGLLNGVTFFLLPLGMIAGGFHALRVWPWGGPRRAGGAPPALLETLALAFGALCVVALYLPVLIPTLISYDARWYHLAIAEHYTALGAIRPFDGGWIAGTLPHLASHLYTWAFLAPGAQLFDRVVLSSHLEFLLFLGTLAGVQVLVRALVPGAPRVAWVALFLFPGILVYDSGLIGGADHVAAFFAVPILLALLQCWRTFDARSNLLLAIFVGACFLTKYSAANLFLLPALVAGGRGAWLWITRRASRREVARGLLALVAGGLLVTAPHWLKNWIFYGAPLYPLLAGPFRPRPWTEDSARLLELFKGVSHIPGIRPPSGALDVLRILATFALVPHDWWIFHRNVPVFGALFSLLSPAFLLLRSRRILGIAALVYGGLAVWALVNMQDRYLQTLVPLMAATSAAALVLLWRMGGWVRWGAAALVAFQLCWSADHPFIPSHSMHYKSTLRVVTEFFSLGYERKYASRFELFEDMPRAAALLPPRSKVLIHLAHMHLGINTPSVLDKPPESIAMSYGRLATMHDMHGFLRGLGITHILWPKDSKEDSYSLADSLIFLTFVSRHVEQRHDLSGLHLARLKVSPPRKTFPLMTLVLGCNTTFKSGLYPTARLHMFSPLPPGVDFPPPEAPWPGDSADQEALLRRASLLAVETSCHTAPIPPPFQSVGNHKHFSLFARP